MWGIFSIGLGTLLAASFLSTSWAGSIYAWGEFEPSNFCDPYETSSLGVSRTWQQDDDPIAPSASTVRDIITINHEKYAIFTLWREDTWRDVLARCDEDGAWTEVVAASNGYQRGARLGNTKGEGKRRLKREWDPELFPPHFSFLGRYRYASNQKEKLLLGGRLPKDTMTGIGFMILDPKEGWVTIPTPVTSPTPMTSVFSRDIGVGMAYHHDALYLGFIAYSHSKDYFTFHLHRYWEEDKEWELVASAFDVKSFESLLVEDESLIIRGTWEGNTKIYIEAYDEEIDFRRNK